MSSEQLWFTVVLELAGPGAPPECSRLSARAGERRGAGEESGGERVDFKTWG